MFKNAQCEMKAKGMKLAYAYEGDCVHNSGTLFTYEWSYNNANFASITLTWV